MVRTSIGFGSAILFIPIAITLNSCGSASMIAFEKYAYIKYWAYREMPPSQVVTNGEVFYEGKLSDGKTFSIGEYIGEPDATYYYNALWQDLGWTLVSKTSPVPIAQTEIVVNTTSDALNITEEKTGEEGNQFTANAGAHIPKAGHIYINLKRGIAVYFYSDKTFDSFRVKVND